MASSSPASPSSRFGRRRGPYASSPYIVSAAYDWAFILLPPVLALAAGVAISGSRFSNHPFELFGSDTTMAALLLGSLIHAHLVAVLFRSHANEQIFRQFRMRFTLIPVVLWLAIMSSEWAAVTATVVATFWDVWHSGAQTFGFARIYDRNVGNTSDRGRNLDLWLNQLLYAGPILAGATFIDHIDAFESYEDVGAAFLTAIPARAEGFQQQLTWAVVIGGTIFVGIYVAAQIRIHARGDRVSPLKTWIVASTGLCSIYTWGFNSWGEAFFIMNLFHAVQYLALVWAMERKTIIERFRLGRGERAKAFAALLFFGSIGAYGLGIELLDGRIETIWGLAIVVSLMHFWYDGFVWSVRRKQV